MVEEANTGRATPSHESRWIAEEEEHGKEDEGGRGQMRVTGFSGEGTIRELGRQGLTVVLAVDGRPGARRGARA